jgi:hypothetical protein
VGSRDESDWPITYPTLTRRPASGNTSRDEYGIPFTGHAAIEGDSQLAAR